MDLTDSQLLSIVYTLTHNIQNPLFSIPSSKWILIVSTHPLQRLCSKLKKKNLNVNVNELNYNPSRHSKSSLKIVFSMTARTIFQWQQHHNRTGSQLLWLINLVSQGILALQAGYKSLPSNPTSSQSFRSKVHQLPFNFIW